MTTRRLTSMCAGFAALVGLASCHHAAGVIPAPQSIESLCRMMEHVSRPAQAFHHPPHLDSVVDVFRRLRGDIPRPDGDALLRIVASTSTTARNSSVAGEERVRALIWRRGPGVIAHWDHFALANPVRIDVFGAAVADGDADKQARTVYLLVSEHNGQQGARVWEAFSASDAEPVCR